MTNVALRVIGLTKTYRTDRGPVGAVRNVDFEVEEGQFYTLLGPSGCGKTTTLRCVAGLERPDSGEIELAGSAVFSSKRKIFVPPHRRELGMVFQSYAIWPHMSVFENTAFPLTGGGQHFSKQEIRAKVEQALALVQLDGLEERPAPQLSGGQQQRLALARALVREPRLLLLDEPLSNLDAKLREEMRTELRLLTQRLGITTLYVTHDQIEALTMSDVVAVMQSGKIVQSGDPAAVYSAPSNRFVADFMGTTNMFEGSVRSHDEAGFALVDTPEGTLRCAMVEQVRPGTAVSVTVRPETITVSIEPPDDAPAGTSVLTGGVESVGFLGDSLDCRVSVGGRLIRVKVNPSNPVRAGQRVYLSLPATACLALPD
jgi:iron(III) transport system ATP-binding protein